MNTKQFGVGRIAILIVPALMLATACAHTPAPMVQEVRDELERVEQNAETSKHASIEIYEAREAFERLERADANDKELDQIAYLAKRRIEIARVSGEAGGLEARVETLGAKRDEVRLSSHVAAANRAKALAEERAREAEQARQAASDALSKAQELQSRVSDLEARETERGVVLTMRNVLFGFNQSNLVGGAKDALTQVAVYLNEFPNRKIVVEGHTDGTGDEAYNRQLSEARARSVSKFLNSNGIDRSRISVKGYGEQSPIAPNDTEVGRQKNRRVEIVLEEDAAQVG